MNEIASTIPIGNSIPGILIGIPLQPPTYGAIPLFLCCLALRYVSACIFLLDFRKNSVQIVSGRIEQVGEVLMFQEKEIVGETGQFCRINKDLSDGQARLVFPRGRVIRGAKVSGFINKTRLQLPPEKSRSHRSCGSVVRNFQKQYEKKSSQCQYSSDYLVQ